MKLRTRNAERIKTHASIIFCVVYMRFVLASSSTILNSNSSMESFAKLRLFTNLSNLSFIVIVFNSCSLFIFFMRTFCL